MYRLVATGGRPATKHSPQSHNNCTRDVKKGPHVQINITCALSPRSQCSVSVSGLCPRININFRILILLQRNTKRTSQPPPPSSLRDDQCEIPLCALRVSSVTFTVHRLGNAGNAWLQPWLTLLEPMYDSASARVATMVCAVCEHTFSLSQRLVTLTLCFTSDFV